MQTIEIDFRFPNNNKGLFSKQNVPYFLSVDPFQTYIVLYEEEINIYVTTNQQGKFTLTQQIHFALLYVSLISTN